MSSSPLSHLGAIHIIPPHEHLSSTLRTIAAGYDRESDTYRVHTSFAWLGHGALVRRALVQEFLDLMATLNASDEEMKMADNYFTVLANRVPELWLDQGIELGGGQPFTVGHEGDERNTKHIVRNAARFAFCLLIRAGLRIKPFGISTILWDATILRA